MKVITVARKPLSEGSVAANVLEHGAGAINVDGCRVGMREARDLTRAASMGYHGSGPQGVVRDGGTGRWPANLIHDGSPEVAAMFPVTGSPKKARTGLRGGSPVHGQAGMGSPDKVGTWPADSGGSAARFFKSVPMGDPE